MEYKLSNPEVFYNNLGETWKWSEIANLDHPSNENRSLWALQILRKYMKEAGSLGSTEQEINLIKEVLHE